MFIEDLIYQLYINCKLNKFDINLVASFVNQTSIGNGFTEKQANLSIRILKRYSNTLSTVLQKDVSGFLDNPNYKLPIRKNNTAKKVSIIEHKIFPKVIKLEFPFNQEKIEIIRKNKSELNFAVWDNDLKSWIFSLEEKNIKFIVTFIENEDFEMDDEFRDYLEQYKSILNNMEEFIPMLVLEDNIPKYVNTSQHIPKLESKEVVPALFEARKAGIFTWNDDINQYLDKINLNPVVRTFLSNENPHYLDINSLEYPIHCLSDIVKYTNPTLFIIPGGSELEKTKMIYNFLIELGYHNDEMSVMFRLSNKDGKEFNEFVKNVTLNNPITEKTKFVFISVKLPKPIIKSKMRFNSVISLGRSNVHYTIREFFKNRQNLIYYCEPNKQRDLNFEFL